MGEESRVESRQVRRARERISKKLESSSMASINRMLMKHSIQKEHYKAPRWHEGSPPPHPTAHPDRYPRHHDPEKGQVYGGECNVTACNRRGAVYWNIGTQGLYCPECARKINYDDRKRQICIGVDEKPDFEERERLKKEYGYP